MLACLLEAACLLLLGWVLSLLLLVKKLVIFWSGAMAVAQYA